MTQGNRTVGLVGEQITSKAARSLRCVLLLLLLVTASPLRAHAQMETLKSIGRWFYDPWGLGDAIGRGGSSLYLSANNATVSGRVAQGIQSRRNSDMLAELAVNPNGAAIHRPRSDQSAAVAAELPILAAGAADVVEGVLAASEMLAGAGGGLLPLILQQELHATNSDERLSPDEGALRRVKIDKNGCKLISEWRCRQSASAELRRYKDLSQPA